jgi:hypothetical protein
MILGDTFRVEGTPVDASTSRVEHFTPIHDA